MEDRLSKKAKLTIQLMRHLKYLKLLIVVKAQNRVIPTVISVNQSKLALTRALVIQQIAATVVQANTVQIATKKTIMRNS